MKEIVIQKKKFWHLARLTLTLMLAFVLLQNTMAQSHTVTGVVADENNVPIPGVNVVLKGSTTGTVTDIDGKYSISAAPTAVITYTFVGYEGQEIEAGDKTTIDVVLKEEVKQLNEVVVIGYGVQKKKLNTGSTFNVGGDKIESLRTNSAMEALKGITPGVSIIQKDGVPGSGTKVVIRGVGTIGNAKPLYVVDGIIVGDIDYLSPSDIESIDILKDAASSAIYGSRAANGVVLVTTKTGAKDAKTVISYDMYYGASNVYKEPELLNARQYIDVMNEANANSGSKPIKWTSLVPDYNRIMNGEWNGTNWFKEILNKNAPVQSHAINITGGGKKSTYSFGGSYYEEEMVLGKQTNNKFKRLTLRMNTSQILYEKNGRSILTLGENLIYTNTKKPSFRTSNIYWNDLHNMLIASPLLPIYDTTGKYHKSINWNPDDVNPIALMEINGKDNTNNNNTINASGYLELQPIPGLNIRSSYGVNNYSGSSRQWRPAYELGPKTSWPRDQVDQSMYNGSTWIWTNTAVYNRMLGQHNITALLGNEMTKNSQDLQMKGHNEASLFNDAEHAYLDNVKIIDPAYTTLNGYDKYGWGMMSYFGRLSYDYKETYMLTFVLRADGSSNFPKGHRWGTFPSVSAGWLLSNEQFMNWSKTWLSSLKVRGSWGRNGNQDIEKYQYLSNQSYELSDYFFGTDKTVRTIGSWPSRVPNIDLSWETAEQLDLGLDMYLLNNKLLFTVDWYKKDTRDWLVKAPALKEWGTEPPFINGGTISNKGVEIVLRWNDRSGDFKYGIGGSLAYNKNEVVSINNDEKIIHGPEKVLSEGTGELFRAQVGYPIGYFWGYKTDGILQNGTDTANYKNSDGVLYFPKARPGDVRLVNTNGDSIINDLDKVMIGDPNPDYTIGIQLDAEYKGFYLMATANGSFGMQVAKSYRSFVDGPKQNYTTDILDRWHGEGTSNKMPRLTNVASPLISDIYIEDADFLKVSNVTFGYNFKQLFKKAPLTEVKLYFAVKNLITFTNYSGMDPEVGYGPTDINDKTRDFPWATGIDLGLYPSSRSYMVGLNVKF